MRLVLITGGVRAGKSRYAQTRAIAAGGDDVTYVATATAKDDEMVTRVARHQSDRPLTWKTVEMPIQLGNAIAAIATPVAILDCVNMLAANAIERARPKSLEDALAAVNAEVDDLARGLAAGNGTLFAVTNEVGLSLHATTAIGRWFQDALGIANQRLAALADEVILVVAGIPMTVKSTPQPRA